MLSVSVEEIRTNTQIKLAEHVARYVHKDQKYGDFDYFGYHVEGVVQKTIDSFMTSRPILRGWVANDFIRAQQDLKCQAVAYLHDAVEDSDELTFEGLRELGFDEDIVIAVAYLTKTEDTIIDVYLVAIRENEMALRVKKADMLFNMENCIKEGNLKRYTKYANQMKVLLGADPEEVL